MPTPRRVRLAAVTPELDWSFRRTCSGDRFDPAVARPYMEDRINRSLALLERAADAGADLVLGPEYFRGSELFMTTPENTLSLCEPLDGPTTQRLRDLARRCRVNVCASFNVNHGGHVVQTAVLAGRDGRLAGFHCKHNTIPAGCPIEKRADLFDLDVGRTGILICADVTDDPLVPLDMARRGMQLLLVPGVGFAGKFWQHYLIVRARDMGCPVVYSDVGRAMIVDREGEVLAVSCDPEDVIVAETEV